MAERPRPPHRPMMTVREEGRGKLDPYRRDIASFVQKSGKQRVKQAARLCRGRACLYPGRLYTMALAFGRDDLSFDTPKKCVRFLRLSHPFSMTNVLLKWSAKLA